MSTRALIVIDIQNDYFPGGKWTLANIDDAADNAARVLAAARAAGDLVIHVRHEFQGEGAPFFSAGSDGAKIHDKVAPAQGEAVILKHHVNSFLDTNLQETLQQNGIKQVVIVGAMSHMCIDAATRAAADLRYEVTVIHDACASRDLEFGGTVVPASQVHAAYMSALGFGYAKLTTAAEFAGAVKQAS